MYEFFNARDETSFVLILRRSKWWKKLRWQQDRNEMESSRMLVEVKEAEMYLDISSETRRRIVSHELENPRESILHCLAKFSPEWRSCKLKVCEERENFRLVGQQCIQQTWIIIEAKYLCLF